MSARAAVVIGVDKTGGLNPLQCAAANAMKVGAWLRREGYKVRVLTDAKRPLHSGRVETALRAYVTKPVRFDLLLVYFSGHGAWLERSDRWLLSGAPTTSSDAINLTGAMDLAKCSGIKTVVFISDACRTIPPEATGQRVVGIDAFPNLGFKTASKVDYFKATSETRSAYEATIPAAEGKTRVSVLTEAWTSAYQEATPAMILEVNDNGRTIDVVPNRRLEGYLQPKVDELLALVDPTIVQTIEVNVPSADDVYISKVLARDDVHISEHMTGGATRPPRGGGAAAASALPALGFPTFAEASVETIRRARTRGRRGASSPRKRGRPDRVESYESQCGLAVSGARVARAESTGRAAGVRTELPDGELSFGIRVWDARPAASVAALLEDGRSFVLPVFAGYIGHVEVNDAGVSNVSYVPSANNRRYPAYLERRDELDRLRTEVAHSVNEGRFQVHGDGASLLADTIRIDKALDPSLGLYAAHAYSSAGLDALVADVLHYMRDDLETSMLDVVMLASRQVDVSKWSSVPFCPLLTQAWNLVRPRGFELKPFLDEIRPTLQDSLWTTFGVGVGTELVDNVARGDFG